MIPRLKTESGFSLLEMIAATAIMALVALLVGTLINIFYRSYMQAQCIGTELSRNQAIDRIADAFIANAVPFEWRNDNLENNFVFKGETNELWLTALRRSYGDDSALWFIRLYQDGDDLKCDYSPTPLLPWLDINDHQYKTETISSNVRSISLLYAEIRDQKIEWLDTWDEDDHEAIPLAIQLKIEWQDGSVERWLRRTAGSSSNSTYGQRREPIL